MTSSIAALTMGKGTVSVYGASNFNVGNVGTLDGNLTTTLTSTADNNETVFGLVQSSENGYANLRMAANDKNISFNGYNIRAQFGNECANGYNVEVNTVNSIFDFSQTRTGAFVQTTERSMGNQVYLGGGANYLTPVSVTADQSVNGEAHSVYVNNEITDSGYANLFVASNGTNNHFVTTQSSAGAFVQGGNGTDVYDINGIYGVYNGVSGYNVFNLAGGENIREQGAMVNVVLGGNQYNAYNDKGMDNLYIGAYAQYSEQTGYDTIRMNGYYGIARFDDITPAGSGLSHNYIDNGFYNTGFMAEEARFVEDKATGTLYREGFDEIPSSVLSNCKKFTVNYNNLLNGTYKFYQRNDGTTWTLKDFYGADASSTGYAAMAGYSLLSNILSA